MSRMSTNRGSLFEGVRVISKIDRCKRRLNKPDTEQQNSARVEARRDLISPALHPEQGSDS